MGTRAALNGRDRDGRVVAEADGPRMRAGRQVAGLVAAGRSRLRNCPRTWQGGRPRPTGG
ncbi:hypothetical protein GCM10027610_111850 [Dactylosporangium cerinum]